MTGAYTVEALDSAGPVLAGQGFDVSFVAMNNPPQNLDSASFQVTVPFRRRLCLFASDATAPFLALYLSAYMRQMWP